MKSLGKDLLKITVFVFIIYLPIYLFSTFRAFTTIENQINQSKQEDLIQFRSAVQSMLQEDRVLEVCQRLAAEQAAGTISAYTLTSIEGNCEFPEHMQTPPSLALGTIQGFKLNGKEMVFLKDATKDVEWTVATNKYKASLIDFLSGKFSKIFIDDIVQTFISIIYIVAAFSFLGVLVLARSIQSQFRKDGKDPFWFKILSNTFGWLHLQDMQIIQSATTAMIRRNENLQKDQDLLETSLEFSILNEIKRNNHKIPYSFHGTVAKVDINGFSKVVSAGQSNEAQSLTKYLEEYGCELLQRYEGLFEKTVGDEIVVVFKTENSALLAVAFARDLMREFSQINFKFGDEIRQFTLKSSICSSELTFSKRLPGYGFFGDALTYATRLLEVVNIKDRNILSCLRSQALEITPLVNIPQEVKNFDFKNMASQEGYLVQEFVKIQDIYDNKPELIKFFRSNDDLLFLLEKVKVETDFEKLNYIFVNFNNAAVRVASAALIAAWIDAMKVFEKRVYQDPGLSFSFSRLIVEGSRLVPIQQWNASCTDAIVSISRYIEGRINASVVDVLIEKDLNIIAIEQEKTFIIESDQSFRTRGNLLINQAIHSLSNTVLDKVIKMIQSPNTLESATGIYCACRIIIYYRKNNPAELETFMSYKKLSKLLHSLYLNKQKEVSPRLLKLLDQVNSYNELTYREVSP